MTRIEGVDLARTIAFVGMVIVNYTIVLQVESGSDVLHAVSAMLEGKAAASFVVLAGLGLAWSLNNLTRIQILKRSLFLLVVGLVNNLVFPADIIHYYAFYFLFGALLIDLPVKSLIWITLAINLVFVAMLLFFDYDFGWNWETLTFHGFWTLKGFLSNLFFNGFHPVFPWLGFLLVGGILAQLHLEWVSVQKRLIFSGLIMITVAQLVAFGLERVLGHLGEEVRSIITTAPLPPTPLYTVTGIGAALVLLGGCLRLEPWLKNLGILKYLIPLGRQTLTWYIGHILIGMWVMEVIGLLDSSQSLGVAWVCISCFCGFALVCAYLWSLKFKQGPLESIMRRLTQ